MIGHTYLPNYDTGMFYLYLNCIANIVVYM